MSIRIGVDTGGTFTDICLYDEAGRTLRVHKVPSTPADPGQAILTGVQAVLAQESRALADVSYFAHGTTVGTNALLTGSGATTGLITTRGFRDLLELGRGRRPHMYDITARKPEPFARRAHRHEVTERVRHTGEVETPLDEAEVVAAVRRLRADGVEAIAVCLLYSFLNDVHERRIGEIIAEEHPQAHVSLSCEVLPEFREFERLSTVVTNAYVGPVVHRYLSRLERRLAEAGLAAQPHVTQSNGGVIPFETAGRLPVRLVLSGPSTGVVGAAEICSDAGFGDIITFDMGGTSSDVSLVQDGTPKVTAGMELDGRPVRSPMLDIHTVGAGGGSVGWTDSGGHLRVGPRSVGADPGPACYGKGSEPSVTDANVALGYLHPDHLLDGRMPIDRSASLAALSRLGEPLGLSAEETAIGMLRVVSANMARAIRVVSVQRGYDPRDYALVPFGGAGPLHAVRLARELGISTVVVPLLPGAQSALGLLMTDLRTDFMATRLIRLVDGASVALREAFTGLVADAEAWFADEGVTPGDRDLTLRLELRYVGQNFELPVTVPADELDRLDVAALVEMFRQEHERLYGYDLPQTPVEAVTFRVQAVGRVATASQGSDTRGPRPGDETLAPREQRSVYDPASRTYQDRPVYGRDQLRPGDTVEGPAVVEQMDTTTVLLPGDRLLVDEQLNLVIRIGENA